MVDAQEGQTVCIFETGGRQELTLRISWAESLLLFRWDAQVLGALPLLSATSVNSSYFVGGIMSTESFG